MTLRPHPSSLQASSRQASSRQAGVFPSAVDLWIAVLLLMSPVSAAALAFYFWMGHDPAAAGILLIMSVGTGLFTLALAVPCRYTIEDENLHVRCGILSYRISLKSIDDIASSGTWQSGPALSMKRIIVHTKLKRYVLSPRDREAFLSELSRAVSVSRECDSES